MPEKFLDDTLNTRINGEDKSSFIQRCEQLGRPWQLVLREVIEAFNEDRLRIVVTDEQLTKLKGMYYVNRK